MINDRKMTSGADFSTQPNDTSLVCSVHVNGKNGTRPPVDHQRIERAVREILAAIGEDPDREGLLETPARVARTVQRPVWHRHAARPHVRGR